MKTLLGIKSSTWSHYETGKSEPSMEGLIMISNFFGITLNELILDDLAEKNAAAIRNRRTRPYAADESFSKLEEPSPAMNYLVKEIRRLRQDLDEIKQAGIRK